MATTLMRVPTALKPLALLVACLVSSSSAQPPPGRRLPTNWRVRRVLLISIDGFHAVDLANYVKLRPSSALARLSSHGVTYANAYSSFPSNSWPGLAALITGGTSVSTGVLFENNYDRSLSPPGSDCSTRGTEVVYDGSIDIDNKALDGGGGIDPGKLPRDPARGCTPVYPHEFLRTNTIFEVIREAGGRTAWSDKHLAYEFTNGPSGRGVVDLYTPEVRNASASRQLAPVEEFDDLRVKAILNQIDGMDHTGSSRVGVPTIFGMNFQAVSFGQKLPGLFGYTDASATPTANLLEAIDHTDRSIGRMLDELAARGLSASTLVIVTAKHGDTPIDPAKRVVADLSVIPAAVNGVKEGLLAAARQDGSVALVWLKDQSRTSEVVAALRARQEEARIQEILAGEALKLRFNDPAVDPRVPDIIVQPVFGTLYVSTAGGFIAEHGGMTDPDMHVALLLSMPDFDRITIKFPVQTTQVAPTILKALGLDPNALNSVRVENTPVLPGLRFDPDLKPAFLAQQPASSSKVPALDFEFFRTRVQPILLEKRPGHTRCVVCHSEGNVAFLQPLAPGATTWDAEQSRRNFEAVSRLVTPGEPMKSPLLLHPLEPDAGGDDFHNGGRQFASQHDQRFQTLAMWVRGQTARGSGK